LNLNSTTPKIKELWKAIWKTPEVAAVVSFIGEAEGELKNEAPLMIQTSKKVAKEAARPVDVVHTYESASSPSFILPSHKHYDVASATVAHTRSLGFLKKHLGGPNLTLKLSGMSTQSSNLENEMLKRQWRRWLRSHTPTVTSPFLLLSTA